MIDSFDSSLLERLKALKNYDDVALKILKIFLKNFSDDYNSLCQYVEQLDIDQKESLLEALTPIRKVIGKTQDRRSVELLLKTIVGVRDERVREKLLGIFEFFYSNDATADLFLTAIEKLGFVTNPFRPQLDLFKLLRIFEAIKKFLLNEQLASFFDDYTTFFKIEGRDEIFLAVSKVETWEELDRLFEVVLPITKPGARFNTDRVLKAEEMAAFFRAVSTLSADQHAALTELKPILGLHFLISMTGQIVFEP